nr:unnamed protein product [Digitaria exilis]
MADDQREEGDQHEMVVKLASAPNGKTSCELEATTTDDSHVSFRCLYNAQDCRVSPGSDRSRGWQVEPDGGVAGMSAAGVRWPAVECTAVVVVWDPQERDVANLQPPHDMH